jgi:hypothetical protein
MLLCCYIIVILILSLLIVSQLLQLLDQIVIFFNQEIANGRQQRHHEVQERIVHPERIVRRHWAIDKIEDDPGDLVFYCGYCSVRSFYIFYGLL